MSHKRAHDGSPRRAGRPPGDDRTPVVIVPKQTAETIAERIRIREEFHDSRATTIKARRR